MNDANLTQKQIQSVCLDMLRLVDRICAEEDIPYFLSGGTLLGAVRHQGFIPWDDDIDIMIPRPDFERFLAAAPKHLPSCYRFVHPRLTEDCAVPWVRMTDLNTVLRPSAVQKTSVGRLFLDVFPIDVLPNNEKLSNLHFRIIRGRDILLKCARRSGLWPDERLQWLKRILMKLTAFRSPRRWAIALDKAAAGRRSFEKAKYAGVVTVTHYGRRERMPIEVFRGSVPVTFEGYQFPAPIGWRTYLTNLYGDYMQLPPVEKRVSLHNMVAQFVPEEERK